MVASEAGALGMFAELMFSGISLRKTTLWHMITVSLKAKQVDAGAVK